MKLWPSKYPCDVFIIHDVDDRETITRELYTLLAEARVKIWYSGKDLSPGCNVHEQIMKGLAASRYGVVILSRNSISSNWLAIELYELLSRAINRRQKTVLPVLHGISMEELKKIIIVPDNIWAISSSSGIKHVVQAITNEIKARPATFREWVWENAHALRIWSCAAALTIITSIAFLYYSSLRPSRSFIEGKIKSRISDFENRIQKEYELNKYKTKLVLVDTIMSVYANFMNMKCYYRNEYEFTNDRLTLRSRRSIEAALGINLTALSPHNSYHCYDPQIHYSDSSNNNKLHSVSYSLLNTKPVGYSITDSELIGEGLYEVEVDYYQENLRYFQVNLLYPTAKQVPKKHHVSMKGYLPREKYIFEKKGETWVLKDIR